MRALAFAFVLVAAACASAPPAGSQAVSPTSAHIVSAVADAARPQADKDVDADRKPAEMLAFAEVQPGDKVGDMLPGRGYFTRVFAKAVGPTGKVYAFNTTRDPPQPILPAIIDDKANYANVVGVPTDFTALKSPEPLDMIWTSRNYHDLMGRGPEFLTAMNKSIYAALKPGGIYIVLDHAAKDDAADDVFRSLHRSKQATVRAQVEAAGFVYVGEDSSVRHAADTRETAVSDSAVRGRTDQYVMKFKKPA
jgi:predicted methyltransferase